jgi:hypothetical protein
MPIAYFEDEPDAEAAASMLKELGFTATVHSCTTEKYSDMVKKFFRGEIGLYEKDAVLESDDAAPDSFETIVIRHHGRPAQGI